MLRHRSKPDTIPQLEGRALEWKPELLVIERVQHVVDRQDDGMLPNETERYRCINDRKVVVVDDRKSRRVEVVVLPSLDVPARHAGARPAVVQVDTRSDRVLGDVQN